MTIRPSFTLGDELGSRNEAAYVKEIIRHRPGAARQLQVYEKTKSLSAVVDYIVEETRQGVPV